MKPVAIRAFRARVMSTDLGLLAFAVALGLVVSGRPEAFFSEGNIVTFVSAGNLLFAAWTLGKIASVRRQAGRPAIWAIMAAGFVFLAADELLRIHELTDDGLHVLFDLANTPMNDRIDDMIVGLYGIVGLTVMAFYRNELKQFRSSFWYLVVGFVFLYLMVAIDTLINRDDLLLDAIGAEALQRAHPWLEVAEEGAKVISEAFLVIAAYRALITARLISPPA